MRRLPPLNALRAFEAAARHMSFKAAAEELRLTPTAISHQIRLLEEILQSPLFRRRPRPLALTTAGARLFPVIASGLDAFAAAVAEVTAAVPKALRVTTTNAFAGRWLVPRLPLWRKSHPDIVLEVIGTDAVVDLRAGEADLAIRYAFSAPADLVCRELLRDRFWPVCSRRLLSPDKPILRPADIARYPIVQAWWPDANPHAPTWRKWIAMARENDPDAANIADASALMFREELHAIEAVIAGQGIGLFSDVLVERELVAGELVRVLDFALPGWGFYLAQIPGRPPQASIEAFSSWIRSATMQSPN